MYHDQQITYFAETDHRERVPFGIKAADRRRHMYVIGKTGMGKSTLLENLAIQDIENGNGMCFVDPHGKTADFLLNYVPKHRVKDVIYFAPFDLEYPMSFNIMEDVGYDKRHLVANGLMSAFKKIWVDAWSARMEYILSNVIMALLEYPDSTLLGVNRMLVDKEYRRRVVDNITDPSVKSFWVDEFAKYSDRYTQDATPAIQNKVGQFTSNPLIRNIIGQPKSGFDLRRVMDEKKILIINLSKGQIGEGNANLLGSMLITKLYLSAMSRADLSEAELNKLPDFYLFVDEFQSFANESFADILSEARKYKLNLTIAHQYIEQMPDEVRSAVFGNVGTMIAFRVGAYDAEVLEKEFAPKFTAEDLVNLGFAQIYLKLMIDGVSSPPFSARTLPPVRLPDVSYREEVIRWSRKLYARPRAEVERAIREWYMNTSEPTSQVRADAVKHTPTETRSEREKRTSVASDTHSQKKQSEPAGRARAVRDGRQNNRLRDRGRDAVRSMRDAIIAQEIENERKGRPAVHGLAEALERLKEKEGAGTPAEHNVLERHTTDSEELRTKQRGAELEEHTPTETRSEREKRTSVASDTHSQKKQSEPAGRARAVRDGRQNNRLRDRGRDAVRSMRDAIIAQEIENERKGRPAVHGLAEALERLKEKEGAGTPAEHNVLERHTTDSEELRTKQRGARPAETVRPADSVQDEHSPVHNVSSGDPTRKSETIDNSSISNADRFALARERQRAENTSRSASRNIDSRQENFAFSPTGEPTVRDRAKPEVPENVLKSILGIEDE